MSEELKPCPNKECRSYRTAHIRSAIGVFNVSCGCGTAGPYAGNATDAIAAWNALPRTVQTAPSDRERRLEEALREAASSLETIAKKAGRDEYMEDMLQVRGYANSRATVARAALDAAPDQHPIRQGSAACEAVFEAHDWDKDPGPAAPDHISQAGKKVEYAALAPEPWGGPEGEE